MRVLVALLLLLAVSFPAQACKHDPAVGRRFQRLHPCPANGHTHGACPGYVKDHRVALCDGGADIVTNLQWQTVADAKAKDVLERKECAGKHICIRDTETRR